MPGISIQPDSGCHWMLNPVSTRSFGGRSKIVAEISRAQLWQWIHLGAPLVGESAPMGPDLYREIRDQELAKLPARGDSRLTDAASLLDRLVLEEAFDDFLTLSAYPMLD